MPRTERFIVTRAGAEGSSRRPDELIVEEPLTIQLDGVTVSTTMRTPGNDYELAVGFCFTEGLLVGARVTGVRYCAAGPAVDTEFNVVSVDTGGLAPPPMPRLGVTSSSCGWCGSDQLDELAARSIHCRTPSPSRSTCCVRCLIPCARHRCCSSRRDPCTPPRCSMPPATSRPPARTSVGTTLSTR
ncbi:MAG: formate dehydrogenase accessory sulfurtransferase FdhD [Ilumatobacteraceae bacterium]